MAKTYEGSLLSGELIKLDEFIWIDPNDNKPKPLKSYKLLVGFPDGSRLPHSISWPDGYVPPQLTLNQVYCFPCTVRFNKKKQVVTWTAHPSIPPFPSPEIG